MISKELLSEVLPLFKKQYDSYLKIDNHTLYEIENDTGSWNEIINIHELAHKVKEWTMSLNVEMSSTRVRNNGILHNKDYQCRIHYWKDDFPNANATENGNNFSADTEPEAIFKAGQWILENR